MLSVLKIASFFSTKFLNTFGTKIDEMKLHKLLYLTQRECLIQYNSPIFGEVFEAWKYGPVVPEVRHYYKDDLLIVKISQDELAPYLGVINQVFESYASQNSWSLSSITHGEYAWQNAYNNSGAKGGAIISTDDMRKDASRVRLRRFLLK